MTTQRIDWSQFWYPGPLRAFTPAEMAEAGADRPSRTLLAVTLFNTALLAFAVLQWAPQRQTAVLSALMMAMVLAAGAAARWLWRRPWRQPLFRATWLLVLSFVGLAQFMRWGWPERADRAWPGGVLIAGLTLAVVMLWFMVIWRAQQIDGRLREAAERRHAIEMARRLANAQVEPHFLFNTLASLQHWVATKDERAGPLLESLTGYLRATLPMFQRPLQPLADELVAVQRYLQVMQARLGERLRYQVDVPAALATVSLPPGLVLTLVENAIEHGVEPQLKGGQVSISAVDDGTHLLLTVQDSGSGPPADAAAGLGLSNGRERLSLLYGTQASLDLRSAPEGGCCALLRVPKHVSE